MEKSDEPQSPWSVRRDKFGFLKLIYPWAKLWFEFLRNMIVTLALFAFATAAGDYTLWIVTYFTLMLLTIYPIVGSMQWALSIEEDPRRSRLLLGGLLPMLLAGAISLTIMFSMQKVFLPAVERLILLQIEIPSSKSSAQPQK